MRQPARWIVRDVDAASKPDDQLAEEVLLVVRGRQAAEKAVVGEQIPTGVADVFRRCEVRGPGGSTAARFAGETSVAVGVSDIGVDLELLGRENRDVGAAPVHLLMVVRRYAAIALEVAGNAVPYLRRAPADSNVVAVEVPVPENRMSR